ncbi:MAG: putative DNA binding domain-containing protein [Chloroflexi bacterium]|nr:putative DNA binding domain-containing protein [Chloroflexota bacterium]
MKILNQSVKTKQQFFAMDAHIHTPASIDYQTPEISHLDILQKAESRGLDIIAFTDHNTISGYQKLINEIEQLELLEGLNRLLADEKSKLAEYRRLLKKILLLPGIEFTATFGFHIIGLFSPKKNLREIEHLLLDLSIPPSQLDKGDPAIGSSVDVLHAYQLINEAGGIVIAAHANSTNGVAMRGINFGGQTRIAYTQDKNLHALEVTDLEVKGSRSTAAFFNGTKPEYPRRMHCIQGSDCHRLNADPSRKKNPGIGDRVTDVLLNDLSFESLRDLFQSNDFSRTRPHRHTEEPAFDFVQSARDEGANIIQDFHESISIRSGKLYAVLSDICAFANTNGGTLFIGLSSDIHSDPVGVNSLEASIKQLEKEVQNRISPPLKLTVDTQIFRGKDIIRVLIPRGDESPYAIDEYKIYIRDENETNIAVRDEIVTLVNRGQHPTPQPISNIPGIVKVENTIHSLPPTDKTESEDPRTGVEVISSVQRGGKNFFTVRDLRNGNIVKNVTQASARRLWHYAILKYDEIALSLNTSDIQWRGNYGLIKQYLQGKNQHYDFVLRTTEGLRFFFGVTPDGIHGNWKVFSSDEDSI